MKKSIWLMLIMVTIACSDKKQDIPVGENIPVGDCIAVSYVRGICGQAVLKILDAPHFNKGENEGDDQNVFLATLECGIDLAKLNKSLFYVELNPDNFNSNCFVCLAALNYSGKLRYTVRLAAPCKSTKD